MTYVRVSPSLSLFVRLEIGEADGAAGVPGNVTISSRLAPSKGTAPLVTFPRSFEYLVGRAVYPVMRVHMPLSTETVAQFREESHPQVSDRTPEAPPLAQAFLDVVGRPCRRSIRMSNIPSRSAGIGHEPSTA